ncbi:chemotaxis protein CheW [Massilia sp. BSC265]|uniref:chemotaxis protein CheW n=1 Tax=Massilia sp. BSC265 TaxID=1549812 RepID=UPI0004E97A03|nr:chemotaxis protein CheW [Massilia sp. BSC265]KFI07428.1 chemotaxis protein CheW [Massilia sp. BSC265]
MTTENKPIEVLAFRLGEEEYGVDILKIQEIRGHDPVTRIANAPDFIEGVVNLRGIIVPIVDLRLRFGITPAANQPRVVVILNVLGRVIGMVVDSVSDVVRLGPDDIRPAPEMGSSFGADFLLGLGTIDERMLILLDIEGLMSSSELGLIDRLAA